MTILRTTPRDPHIVIQAPLGRRSVAAATAVTTMVVLPPFLLGGTAILIREDLGFDAAYLGFTAAAFFLCTSASSVFGGRIAERVGPRRGMLLAASVSAVTLAAASQARSWGVLTAILAFGGLGNGLGQPAANLAIVRGVPRTRQGFAFGIKQSAIPIAGLFSGLSVPAIGIIYGWRVAFLVAAASLIVVAPIVPRIPHVRPMHERGAGRSSGDAPLRPLAVLAGGCMLATMSSQSLGVFTVESAVNTGFRLSTAGLILGAASVASIGSRLIFGWSADRTSRAPIVTIAWMLTIGGGGMLLLAGSTAHPLLILPGSIIGFALGWGWPGLFFLAVTRLNPNAPALASGITQVGGALGGVLGPILFGQLVIHASFATAWTVVALLSASGGALMLVGRRMLLTARPAASTAQIERS